MRVEREDSYFCDDRRYEKLVDLSVGESSFENASYPINADGFRNSDEKTVGVSQVFEDVERRTILCKHLSNETDVLVQGVSKPYPFEESSDSDRIERHVTTLVKTTGYFVETIHNPMDERLLGEVPNVEKADTVEPEPLVTSFITMENSNNAIDSASMFKDHRQDGVYQLSNHLNHKFKLPNNELNFNGTLKHLQKLMPIVDTSAATYAPIEKQEEFSIIEESTGDTHNKFADDVSSLSPTVSDKSTKSSALSFVSQFTVESGNIDESTSSRAESANIVFLGTPVDSKVCSSADVSLPVDICNTINMSEDYNILKNKSCSKYNSNQGDSFNSGIASPDLFCDDEIEEDDCVENLDYAHNIILEKDEDSILKKFAKTDKVLAGIIEKKLHGIPPPPSVTNFNMGAGDILRLYKSNLPIFEKEEGKKFDPEISNLVTPTKRATVWFQNETALASTSNCIVDDLVHDKSNENIDKSRNESTNSLKSNEVVKLCAVNCDQNDAENKLWPDILKCRYYGLHYNTNDFIEQAELLSLRYIDRYVGAETGTTCTAFSVCSTTPSSAQKRKQRSKLAPAKSPGRRLSYLARRRQTFCSAATISDTTTANSRMVLIDRNFFPHRKLTGFQTKKIRTPGKKVIRRTPGKKTPAKKTPRKKTPLKNTPARKTPRKTPTSTNKSSLRKMIPSSLRSHPNIGTSKRALFVSPEQMVVQSSNLGSKPMRSIADNTKVLKSKRALFESPRRNLTSPGNDLDKKRKRDDEDCGVTPMQRSKITKSLSFSAEGCENSNKRTGFLRRASESQFGATNNLSELHERKILWAVAQALRERSFGHSHPLYRTHANNLRQVLRVLLNMPTNAQDVADTKKSTSDTMLKLARQYVYFVINGSTLEEIVIQEKKRIASLNKVSRLSVYLNGITPDLSSDSQSAGAFTNSSAHWNSENSHGSIRSQRIGDSIVNVAKTVLQDKAVNFDNNSNSNSSVGSLFSDTASVKSDYSRDSRGRARRQIKFDNVDDLTR